MSGELVYVSGGTSLLAFYWPASIRYKVWRGFVRPACCLFGGLQLYPLLLLGLCISWGHFLAVGGTHPRSVSGGQRRCWRVLQMCISIAQQCNHCAQFVRYPSIEVPKCTLCAALASTASFSSFLAWHDSLFWSLHGVLSFFCACQALRLVGCFQSDLICQSESIAPFGV